jgi:RNA polymerase sigma-70 factor (ECF subfamily)
LDTVPSIEAIYAEHFDSVWHYLRRLGVPAADRDDLAQEVFLTVHRRLDTYDPSRPLRPWVIGICARTVLHYWRTARRRPADPTDLPALERAAASTAPDHEHRLLLAQLLGGLDADKRTLFVLHELEGFSVPELAELSNQSINTVYSRLRRTRQELAAVVAAEQRAAPAPARDRARVWQALAITLAAGKLVSVAHAATSGRSLLRVAAPIAAASAVAITAAALLWPRRSQPGRRSPEPIVTAAAVVPPPIDAPTPDAAVTAAAPAAPRRPIDRRAVEDDLIERANVALARARFDEALALLTRHEREFARGARRGARELLFVARCSDVPTARVRSTMPNGCVARRPAIQRSQRSTRCSPNSLALHAEAAEALDVLVQLVAYVAVDAGVTVRRRHRERVQVQELGVVPAQPVELPAVAGHEREAGRHVRISRRGEDHLLERVDLARGLLLVPVRGHRIAVLDHLGFFALARSIEDEEQCVICAHPISPLRVHARICGRVGEHNCACYVFCGWPCIAPPSPSHASAACAARSPSSTIRRDTNGRPATRRRRVFESTTRTQPTPTTKTAILRSMAAAHLMQVDGHALQGSRGTADAVTTSIKPWRNIRLRVSLSR